MKTPLLPALAILLLIMATGCDPYAIGYGQDPGPEEIDLPSNPIERAAVQGLKTSYRESTMWQIQKARVIRTTPVAPTAAVVEDHDPKELYCVCVEYEARYKVPWTTTEASPWERTVRNLLVMRTQADALIAVKPMNICAAFCE
ncbi:hypothetical protein C4J81_13380 [Deltaproteobacteria bacterium Smac51]|nr:hypothetical protein C4J81_13380 [Deltaproteobacteria bacterium Smac51]